MKKSIMLFLAIAIASISAACSMIGGSVCDDLQPGDSYLCSIADQMDVRLEDIGDGLIVANSLAIGNGNYTQEQALSVLYDLRNLAEGPISYRGFNQRISELLDKYPGLFVVGLVYLNRIESTRIIKKADAEILKGWLDRQISILER